MKRTVKGPFNFHIFLYVHIIYKKRERYIGENVEKITFLYVHIIYKKRERYIGENIWQVL